MTTKKIILKESDIKDIVEKVINELDWRTYASAYDKEKSNPARSNRFKDAATNAFNRQNGYGMTNIPYGDGDPSQTQFNSNGAVYGGSMMYTPKGTQFNTTSGKTTNKVSPYDTNATTTAGEADSSGSSSSSVTSETIIRNGYTDTDTHSLTRKGNIGVTTSQQMLQSERDIAMFSIIEEYFRELNKNILISLW